MSPKPNFTRCDERRLTLGAYPRLELRHKA